MGDLRDPKTVIALIISGRQRTRVKDHTVDAVAKGAKVVAGGEWDGNRCQPTLLINVSEDMAVCWSETFGLVTSIYLVAAMRKCSKRRTTRSLSCHLRSSPKISTEPFTSRKTSALACATLIAQRSTVKPMCLSVATVKVALAAKVRMRTWKH